MAHHHHEDDDLYYLGQLGLVFFSALYAAFALALSFHWTSVLNRLLAKHLQPYLLWSGLVLMAFAVIRGCVLWVQVGKSSPDAHGQEYDQDITLRDTDDTIVQDPDAAHENEASATLHESPEIPPQVKNTAVAAAEHAHAHDDHHHHDHDDHHHHHHADGDDHAHDDHEHGWEPMRYLVLALAIGLFFLLYFWGLLPYMAPQITAMDIDKDLKVEISHEKEAVAYVRILAMGPSLSQVGLTNVLINDPVEEISFDALLTIKDNTYAHDQWRGKTLRIWGQFAPTNNPKYFAIVRFRMQCCGADAVPVPIPVTSRTAIEGFQKGNWIKVTGKVDFGTLQGESAAVLHVNDSSAVKQAPTDPDPYIQ